jgi:polysaccharide export outer membrane protein
MNYTKKCAPAMPKNWLILLILTPLVLFNSCGIINSNKLLYKEKKETFQFDSLNIAEKPEAILQVGDRISLTIATNNGEKIVFNSAGIESNYQQNNQQNQAGMALDYIIKTDGTAKLPILGNIALEGKTIAEAENLLTSKLSSDFKDPFVQIKITNQRVVLLLGKGHAIMVPMANSNMTLLEVIALGGGIKDNAKSKEIRLLRMEKGKRKVYHFDLSNIKNAANADIAMVNKDIVVIDYYPRKITTAMREASPWLSIISSTFAIYTILSRP